METTCGILLTELQKIWEEIGEPDSEKDKMLLELERECLELYRKKVDAAKKGRAQLRQAIADTEAELVDICSALHERPIHVKQNGGRSLREELESINVLLEDMRNKRRERRKQFVEIIELLKGLSEEIYGAVDARKIFLEENDLSLTKLEDLQRQLYEFQNEKSNRLKLVTDHLRTLNMLCTVLGIDFKEIVKELHITMHGADGVKSVRSDTIDSLYAAIESLRALRTTRMQRLQEIAAAILELWNLMDTPLEEQQKFLNITSHIAVSEEELTEPNLLSADFICYAEAELSKLDALKMSKMKELVLKKKLELDDVCRKTHINLDECAVGCALEDLDSGISDPMFLLESIELQIARLKEEAFSRKEILEKIEKWFAAREEEAWLEEYSRDDNRYNAGRGAHLSLKRAEKARIISSKIPAMVEALAVKANAWQNERGSEFLYDGVSLLSMLEQYNFIREEKELERQRQKEEKKLMGQLLAEQEALYGSKPSPSKSGKKAPRMSSVGTASNRRATMVVPMHHAAKFEKAAASQPRSVKKGDAMIRSKQNRQQYGGALPGDGYQMKKPSKKTLNASENNPAMLRKPFSPVSSHVNMVSDDSYKMLCHSPPVAPSGTKTADKTPPKFKSPPQNQLFSGVENITPNKMYNQQPITPATVRMYTATTPATPGNPSVIRAINMHGEETEYSFEERRAGFCPI